MLVFFIILCLILKINCSSRICYQSPSQQYSTGSSESYSWPAYCIEGYSCTSAAYVNYPLGYLPEFFNGLQIPYQSSPACCQCLPGHFKSESSSPERCSQVSDYSKSECIHCPVGTYSDTFGSRECTLCPSGTYNPLVASSTSLRCLVCPNGTYSRPGSSACVDCPAGKYSNEAASTCTDCPAGHYSTAQSSTSLH